MDKLQRGMGLFVGRRLVSEFGGITTATGEHIGEQTAKNHCYFLCESITCRIHSVDPSSTIM